MVKFRIYYLDWFENVIFAEVVKMASWTSAEEYAVEKSKEVSKEKGEQVKLLDIVQI